MSPGPTPAMPQSRRAARGARDGGRALRRRRWRWGLALDCAGERLTSAVARRPVRAAQWSKIMRGGADATPLPTANTTGDLDHAAFRGTINPDTNNITT